MPRALLLASLVILLLASVSGAVAAPARIARPGAELRAEPGFGGPVLARPPAGSAAELVESRNEWRRVRVADPAAEGWLHQLFVEAVPGGALPAPAPGVVEPPPSAPVAAPLAGALSAEERSRWDVERGEYKALIAELRAELMTASGRAEMAENAAARLDARVRELERAAAEAAPPEPSLRETCRDLLREEDERCAQEAARQVQAAVASELARVQAEHERALAECRARLVAAPPPAAEDTTDAAEIARLTAELEAERAAHAAHVARIEGEHQRLHDTYVDIVTQRHEEALARDREACADDCNRRLLEETRRHDREIRAARKESGWEIEFEKELRARTKLVVEEAEARCEAKRRGEAYDEQRIRRDEEARVRKLCDGERFSAVQAALAEQGRQSEALRRRELEESDLRCQVALEIVLERAAAGEDLTGIREFARERTRRAEPEAAPSPAPEPREGSAP